MTRIVAHRGGALLWPENSRAACRGAVALGADEIQLDVHMTCDGHVAVIHDATLDRTTTATGPVAVRTADRLRRVALSDAGGETVPLLDELMPIIGASDARLRLELKHDINGGAYPDLITAVAGVLHLHEMQDRTVVSAFAAEDLDAARAVMPRAPIVWLLGSVLLASRSSADIIAQAVDDRVDAVGIRWNALPDAFAGDVRRAGLGLEIFGCHDDATIAAALALRPDAVMTDRPDLALRLRDT